MKQYKLTLAAPISPEAKKIAHQEQRKEALSLYAKAQKQEKAK